MQDRVRLLADNVTPGALVAQWRNDAAAMRRLGQESFATLVETLATDLDKALGNAPSVEGGPVVAEAATVALVGVEEASRILGLSTSYLYRHRAELPFARKIGTRLLFDRAGMAAWSKEQRYDRAA
jgi:hypothetical protein